MAKPVTKRLKEIESDYRGMTTVDVVTRTMDYMVKQKGIGTEEAVQALFETAGNKSIGYEFPKKRLYEILSNGNSGVLIGPPGTGKSFLVGNLGDCLVDTYESGAIGDRYHPVNCKVREDAVNLIMLRDLLKQSSPLAASVYGKICPHCKADLPPLSKEKQLIEAIDEIEVERTPFIFEKINFGENSDKDEVKPLIWRSNMNKEFSGATPLESITLGNQLGTSFKLVLLDEIQRAYNNNKNVFDPLFQILEKKDGRSFSTPAGDFPVDILIASTVNQYVAGGMEVIRRLGEVVPFGLPTAETDEKIIQHYVEATIKRTNTASSNADPVYVKAREALGWGNGFEKNIVVPDLAVKYIAQVANLNRPANWCTDGGFELIDNNGNRNSLSKEDWLGELDKIMDGKWFLTTDMLVNYIIEPLVREKFAIYNREKKQQVISVNDIDSFIRRYGTENGLKSIDGTLAQAKTNLKAHVWNRMGGKTGYSDIAELQNDLNEIKLKLQKKEPESVFKEYDDLWEILKKEAKRCGISPVELGKEYISIVTDPSK